MRDRTTLRTVPTTEIIAVRLQRVGSKLFAALFALILTLPALATADGVRTFNIRQQPMSSALNEFARQSDRPILFSSDAVGSKHTAGVRGDLEPEAALKILLKGTGLTFRTAAHNTILIEQSKSGETTDTSKSPDKEGSGIAVRLAQAPRGAPQSDSSVETDTQSEAAKPVQLEEIVVTALKRETNLQDTPVAISAVSGAQLSSKGITDISALASVSPGLVVTESQVTGSRLTLRNIYAAGEPTVGLYYDETPVIGSSGTSSDAGGTTPDIRLFDVQRVEVLRGPQGTLYGASSMGGTVRLIFAKPDLERLTAAVDGKVFDVDQGGVGGEGQAMVNVPLIDGELGMRATGFYQNKPGYVDDILLGQQDVNAQQSRGGRVMIRAKPTSSLTIDALAVIQDVHSALNDYLLNLAPNKENYESLQPVRDQFQLFSSTLNWDLGPVALTAVGSHSYRDFNYSFDISPFFRTLAALIPGQAAFYNSEAPAGSNSPQITKTDTAEIRLVSKASDPLQWTVGGYYSNRRGNFLNNIARANPADGELLPINAATLLGQRGIFDGLKQTAGFAELTYNVTNRLSITGGGRYFNFTRSSSTGTTITNPAIGYVAQPVVDLTTSQSGWLYKANLGYKVSDDILAYGTVSTGERPGGVNQAVGLPASLQSYKSDEVTNYELGLKSELLDHTLVLDSALFQMNWSNMQTTGETPGSNFSFIANASQARVQGLETELTVQPLHDLTLQGSGSYIVGRLTRDQGNSALTAPGVKGDYIPYVPKMTLQGGADYNIPVSSAFKAILHADCTYVGSSWTQFERTDEFQQRLPAYATLGLRGSLGAPDDNWVVSLYGKNITNNDAQIQKLPETILFGIGNVRAIGLQPREVGIEFQKRFQGN
jgi:outer membrane receptor protein involved in Fe transport